MYYKHLDTLIKYIEYISDKEKLFIKIHDFDGFLANSKRTVKSVFGSHPGYCTYIRSSEDALRYCLEKELDVMEKCKECKPFYGTCYAGVKMYIVPLFYEDKLLGFVSASRSRCEYEQAESRIEKVASKFHLDSHRMNKLYFNTLGISEDIGELEIEINTIASMLELLRSEFTRSAILQGPADNKKVLCRKIIDYINMAYMSPLSLDVFTNYFNCSRSLISHSFRAQTGMSIKQYIKFIVHCLYYNIRMSC